MKYFPFVLIIIFLCACNVQPPADVPAAPGTKRVKVSLSDPGIKTIIGDVRVDIPLKWDTMHQWRHYSCNTPVDRIKYRFQSSSNPVFDESGFFWQAPADSADGLTISHHSLVKPAKTDWSRIERVHRDQKKAVFLYDANPVFYADTIIAINDFLFSVISEKPGELNAETFINNVVVTFSFRYAYKRPQPDSADFFKRSVEILKTVKITPAQLPLRKQG